MSMITLYHGSPDIIERPTYGFGNPHNDYGLGFYCTESLAMAQEWGCVDGNDGFANEYRLDMDGLSCLDLSGGGYNVLNWLAILLDNRTVRLAVGLPRQAAAYIAETFLPAYREFDVIRGYRADDSYFAFSSAFLNGSISLEQLQRAMRLGKLGEQVVLRSQKAFPRLGFVKATPAKGDEFYPRKTARNSQARQAFQEMSCEPADAKAHYVIDMLREGWTNDSPCL